MNRRYFQELKNEPTSAAEKKESSEEIVVASSSRSLWKFSTWGKVSVPSLSAKGKEKHTGWINKSIQLCALAGCPNPFGQINTGGSLLWILIDPCYFHWICTLHSDVLSLLFWNRGLNGNLQLLCHWKPQNDSYQSLPRHCLWGYCCQNLLGGDTPCGVVSLASQRILCYVFQPAIAKGREPKYIRDLNIMSCSYRVNVNSVSLLWYCNMKYFQGLFYCTYELWLPQEGLQMLPPAELGCCCWRLSGLDGEYSGPVPTLLKLPQTAPSLRLKENHA